LTHILFSDLTDAITKDWGSKPFVDLQNGWKYALDKYPEIDPDRAVAAGASWVVMPLSESYTSCYDQKTC